MKRIGAAKFKEQCLALLDQLDAEGLVVTKRGKPVARVLPYDSGEGDLIGSSAAQAESEGGRFHNRSPLTMRMINLDTHILIFALSGELRPGERNLLARSRWSVFRRLSCGSWRSWCNWVGWNWTSMIGKCCAC